MEGPNIVIHAVIGNNNSLENVNSHSGNNYDINQLISENEDLKAYAAWACNQIKIKDTLLRAFISKK